MIDKELLLEEVDAKLVAEYLGMEVVKKGVNYCIPCPGHKKRLGKEDTTIGNCIIRDKGYYCFACGKYVDVFDMVMEFTGCNFGEALKTVAESCGGEKFFETGDSKKIKDDLPLKSSELKIIGLTSTFKSSSFINVLNQMEDLEFNEDLNLLKRVKNEYLIEDKTNEISLFSLYKEHRSVYENLIRLKAKEAIDKYQDLLDNACSRGSKYADVVFDLLNDNGYIENSIFYDLKNEIEKRLWKAKEIYNLY